MTGHQVTATAGSTERGSAPATAAAPFFRGVAFALVGSLALWGLVALGWWLA